MPSDQLNAWITEGIMNPTHILQRLTEQVNDYAGLRDEEYIQLKQHFDSLCTISDGPRLTKTAFLSFLQTQGTLPASLTEAGSILFDSLRYLSQAPFSHRRQLPESLSLEEFLRVLTWTNYDKARYINREGNLCRGCTPADHRRVIFQSLATTRDGSELPFDPEDWRKQADRRAFDELAEYRCGNAGTNCDEDGDEMYHDVVDVVFSTQPVISEALAPVFRDKFRTLAKELHGDYVRLNQLSIPPGRLCELLKLLLVAQFGGCGMLPDKHVSELECVAECIIRPFQRVPGVGITWPMFDNAASVVPLLFNSVYTITSTIIKPPEAYYALENVIPESGRILTLPRLTQLAAVLYDNIAWDELQLFHHYNLKSELITAVNLANAITTTEGPLLLLVSGNITNGNRERNEDAVFGVFIADNAHDGTEIQPKGQVDWDSTFLFQLSPIHDIFRGTVGRAGWQIVGEKLCFGASNGGVGLVLEENLRRATLAQSVDGKEGVYEATEWRGNWSRQVEVKAIEIWGYE